MSSSTTQIPGSDFRYEIPVSSGAGDLETRWSPATRVGFRFCFVYVGLYILTTQMLPSMIRIPGVGFIRAMDFAPVRAVFWWLGVRLLGVHEVPFRPSGSGDKLFDWVQAFSLLVIAGTTTIVWTLRDKNRPSYARLYRWFRLLTRLALATTMFSYGFAKLIPLQMGTTFLWKLVEPFGDFSPMGVIWTSIGAAPAYEVFTGSVEVLAGVLLFIPRTTQLGAMLSLTAAFQVFMINMTYDVPVKLFSFHLILFSLVLLAPNLRRLFDFFIGHRTVALAGEPPLSDNPRSARRLEVAQLVFGGYCVAYGLFGSVQGYSAYGAGAPKSAFRGIWDVEELRVDARPLQPLLTDSTRWKRVIFELEHLVMFQQMNDRFVRFNLVTDTTKKTLALSPRDTTRKKTTLTYARISPDRLTLDGVFDGKTTHFGLKLRDEKSFLLRSRGFNWVQEFPVNR